MVTTKEKRVHRLIIFVEIAFRKTLEVGRSLRLMFGFVYFLTLQITVNLKDINGKVIKAING